MPINTRGHNEFAMTYSAVPAGVPRDGHVVRRVDKDHIGFVIAQQQRVVLGTHRVTTEHPVLAKPPEITQSARRCARWFWKEIGSIVLSCSGRSEVFDDEIDFPHVKASF